MKNKVENIFIDTSIYQDGRFIESSMLKTLFNAAAERRIKILLPEITEREVLLHITKCAEEERMKLIRISSSLLKLVPEIKGKLDEAIDASKEASNKLKDSFISQLSKSHIERIPLQKDIDYSSIIDAYFEKKPPFSEKKKSEFPDAIVLKSLECWRVEKNQKCILLSLDNDIRTYKSDLLVFKECDQYTKDLARRIQEEEQREAEIERIKLMAYNELMSDISIKTRVADWVYDLLDNECVLASALSILEVNDYSIERPNIEFSEECEIVGTYESIIVYRVRVNAETVVIVDHPDYDTGYYDSEDKQWYFIDDSVETKIISNLEFDLEYSTDQEGNYLDLVAINGNHSIGTSKLIDSFDSNTYW